MKKSLLVKACHGLVVGLQGGRGCKIQWPRFSLKRCQMCLQQSSQTLAVICPKKHDHNGTMISWKFPAQLVAKNSKHKGGNSSHVWLGYICLLLLSSSSLINIWYLCKHSHGPFSHFSCQQMPAVFLSLGHSQHTEREKAQQWCSYRIPLIQLGTSTNLWSYIDDQKSAAAAAAGARALCI